MEKDFIAPHLGSRISESFRESDIRIDIMHVLLMFLCISIKGFKIQFFKFFFNLIIYF